MTVGEIAESTRLSKSTVYTLLGYYKAQYLVTCSGKEISYGRGRNPRTYMITNKGLRKIKELGSFYDF